MVSEHREGEAELTAVEGAGRFADDHGLESPVRAFEGIEKRQRFGAALPRQGSTLADVEVLGDDHPTFGEDGRGPAHLPLFRGRWVLLVLGADPAIEGEFHCHRAPFRLAGRLVTDFLDSFLTTGTAVP